MCVCHTRSVSTSDILRLQRDHAEMLAREAMVAKRNLRPTSVIEIKAKSVSERRIQHNIEERFRTTRVTLTGGTKNSPPLLSPRGIKTRDPHCLRKEGSIKQATLPLTLNSTSSLQQHIVVGLFKNDITRLLSSPSIPCSGSY